MISFPKLDYRPNANQSFAFSYHRLLLGSSCAWLPAKVSRVSLSSLGVFPGVDIM
jgi:hypothetical protein